MKRNIILTLNIIAITLLTSSCEKNNTESDLLSFPVGRSFPGSGKIEVKINDVKYDPDFAYDSCGGYWLNIPKTELSEADNLVIQFTRRKEDLVLFNEVAADRQKWISHSFYIDSDNETIKAKASGLRSLMSRDAGIPVTLTGRLGFRLISDNRPDSMIAGYSYDY